ncbi:MAG: sulfur carrier protein ThiS [Desulfurivibrionaceae bacterium]
MRIICNGEDHNIQEGLVLTDYLKSLGLDPSAVVVEYNGRIIDRKNYDSQVISEGAKLELIHFVPGG